MANFGDDIPLGKDTAYPDEYSPELLFPIQRLAAREQLGLEAGKLPFAGVDIWNAYELSWLNPNGLPQVAFAKLFIPCDSAAIVESKSLKLYLNSLNHKVFVNRAELQKTMVADLSAKTGSAVLVEISDAEHQGHQLGALAGECLDDLEVAIDRYQPDAGLLKCGEGREQDCELHSHLFRSLCPVTAQPDWASVYIRFSGTTIEREGLLKYLVSYRQHQGFHEQCVEGIFRDINQRCQPDSLLVYARFLRRGGLDINPLRYSRGECDHNLLGNVRLWRQ